MVLTREQRIAKHKHFLNTGWDAYAAFAWEHFLSEGRGMVTVPEEDLLQDDPVSNPPRLAYAAKGSTLLMEISLHFESKELDWLETYDPDERVIIIVVLTDQGTSGYLVGEKTKPSEAFAKQKAHHNAL